MVFGGSRLPDWKREKSWRLPTRLTLGLGMDRITHRWPWNDLYPPDTFVSCFERVLQQTKQINSGATKGSVNLISRNMITDFTLQWTSFLRRLRSSLHPSNKSSSQLENHLGFKVKVVLQMSQQIVFFNFLNYELTGIHYTIFAQIFALIYSLGKLTVFSENQSQSADLSWQVL